MSNTTAGNSFSVAFHGGEGKARLASMAAGVSCWESSSREDFGRFGEGVAAVEGEGRFLEGEEKRLAA